MEEETNCSREDLPENITTTANNSNSDNPSKTGSVTSILPQESVPNNRTSAIPSPPKKSARLAEKRKLMEEAGPLSTNQDEEFYFTPFKSCRLSSPLTVKGENQIKTVKNEEVHVHVESSQSTNLVKDPAPLIQEPKTDNSDCCNEEDNDHHEQAIAKLGTSRFADDSSEEDKWFDSLDVGKLDDDVLDIDGISTTGRLLTERQKSFIFRQDTGFSMEEPSEFPLPKELAPSKSRSTNGRKEKSERRRVLAQQKKEYDKKRIVDRLLKKPIPHAKLGKGTTSAAPKNKVSEPMITYAIRRDSHSISFPPGIDISIFGGEPPTTPKTASLNHLRKECGVEGCLNLKKYTCSKTKIPLCSLECYKKNLQILS